MDLNTFSYDQIDSCTYLFGKPLEVKKTSKKILFNKGVLE